MPDRAISFIREQTGHNGCTIRINTASRTLHVTEPGPEHRRAWVDLRLLNSHRDLNAYLRDLHHQQSGKAVIIGCAETITERKVRFRQSHSRLLFPLAWLVDFLLHRVIAKMGLTRNLYSLFTQGKYQVISKAEVLGRLTYSGFEIIKQETIANRLYYAVRKNGEPQSGENPSFGILFKMKRIGLEGRIIGVYKVRTMHPYSEYIQHYVVQQNGYNKTGKPEHDFRLTSWGKILRKLHLDEAPQLLNVVRGELNLVGVRPLSEFGFNALPADLQKARIKYKPGCIPPNVALGVTGFDGVIRAERIYLRALAKNKMLTNSKYFFMALYHLLTHKSRSA